MFCRCWSVVWCASHWLWGFWVYYFVSFSSFAIILKRKKELVGLLLLSYGCLVTVNVLWFFLMVPWVGLWCVILVFPDHSHLLLYNPEDWLLLFFLFGLHLVSNQLTRLIFIIHFSMYLLPDVIHIKRAYIFVCWYLMPISRRHNFNLTPMNNAYYILIDFLSCCLKLSGSFHF